MALEIKRITKTDGSTTVRVLSPGTIYQLITNIKKTQRNFNKMQKNIKNNASDRIKEECRSNWLRRAQFVRLIED